MSGLSKDQIVDLLQFIGVEKIGHWRGNNLNFCCPIHQESHPSAGICSDFQPEDSCVHYQVFNCFACHEKGNLAWFLYKSMPDDFRNVHQAEEFLKDRYGVTFYGLYGDDDGDIHIKRYGEAEIVEGRYTVPIYNLAPYMSGKETFQYFFDRGFTRDTVRSFKIGRDINHMTVTIPVFWEDGVLAGIIGRYAVPRPKNSRYKIYAFPKGNMLFPLDHFIAPSDGGIILVEGTFDALRMYQNGFTNTLATLTDSMSDAQAKWIKDHAQYVIDMFDNDRGGLNARETARKQLQGMPYYTVEYPEGKKDPCDCTMSEIHTMIDNKMGLLKRPLRRL